MFTYSSLNKTKQEIGIKLNTFHFKKEKKKISRFSNHKKKGSKELEKRKRTLGAGDCVILNTAQDKEWHIFGSDLSEGTLSSELHIRYLNHVFL